MGNRVHGKYSNCTCTSCVLCNVNVRTHSETAVNLHIRRELIMRTTDRDEPTVPDNKRWFVMRNTFHKNKSNGRLVTIHLFIYISLFAHFLLFLCWIESHTSYTTFLCDHAILYDHLISPFNPRFTKTTHVSHEFLWKILARYC